MRFLIVATAAILLSGCMGADAPVNTLPAEPSPTTAPSSFIAFEKCAEMNVNTLGPAALDSFPPFIRPVRTANYLTTYTHAFDGCETGSSHNGTEAGPVFFSIMVPVEPIPDATIEGAVGYLFITDIVASSPLVIDAFLPFYPVLKNEVELTMSSLANAPNTSGLGVLATSSGDREYRTTMAPRSQGGPTGVLGVYSVDQKFLHLHKVTFSDFRNYGSGTSVIMYPSPSPDTPPSTESWPATHNVDFDVRFDFDVFSRQAYP